MTCRRGVLSASPGKAPPEHRRTGRLKRHVAFTRRASALDAKSCCDFRTAPLRQSKPWSTRCAIGATWPRGAIDSGSILLLRCPWKTSRARRPLKLPNRRRSPLQGHAQTWSWTQRPKLTLQRLREAAPQLRLRAWRWPSAKSKRRAKRLHRRRAGPLLPRILLAQPAALSCFSLPVAEVRKQTLPGLMRRGPILLRTQWGPILPPNRRRLPAHRRAAVAAAKQTRRAVRARAAIEPK